MFDNTQFQKLVEADNLTGEVVAVNRFIVEIKGLEGVQVGAQILFEDGQRGMVREAHGNRVLLYNIDSEDVALGSLVVAEKPQLSIPVGKELVGRVINPMGVPLDGKGSIKTTRSSGIFTPAPGIMDRKMLDEQLASGVTAVDSFFPIVLGQRIAILGDSKAGKSTFLGQLSANQQGTDRLVVYVLIGKRKVDVEHLISELNDSGAINNTIIVHADIFDSLTQSYLAPYAGCAMAEDLWYNENRDVIIIYDDLSGHAEAYRQLSLLQEVDPGRDSYPGDIFYTHSSLLERAGKLLTNEKTLTSLPVVLTPNDDITAYLPTNIMSITDGQIIFDLGFFRKGVRPAVNAGLSVSRVGGQAQTKRQKQLSTALFKSLAKYHQAEEFSHFSSQLSKETRLDLARGKHLYMALQQPPEELFSLVEQQLMLETIMLSPDDRPIDVAALRKAVKERAKDVSKEEDYDAIEAELFKAHSAEPPAEKKPATTDAASPAENADDKDKSKNKKDEKHAEKKKEPEHAKS
ncbi:MAG TPA: sodium-transporting two-sector ATPase [Candidatus Saccharibacteria bacterium]|nr:sodium-transporting two-sector ATPase [Candidatus Saccharibacteria bacterium]